MPGQRRSSPGGQNASLQPANEERCPDCGARVAGGRAGCQAAWDAFSGRAYQDWPYSGLRDLAFDTYCMQHPDTYCSSAKSYAAHLTRLCCGIEYGADAVHPGDPVVYAAIQKWLNGRVPLEKPGQLAYRGAVTVVDVQAAQTAEEYRQRVKAWAQSVWEAYRGQHGLAHAWIQSALVGRGVQNQDNVNK
jgi:hypothetical protein